VGGAAFAASRDGGEMKLDKRTVLVSAGGQCGRTRSPHVQLGRTNLVSFSAERVTLIININNTLSSTRAFLQASKSI